MNKWISNFAEKRQNNHRFTAILMNFLQMVVFKKLMYEL
jgi:hypothetical protein